APGPGFRPAERGGDDLAGNHPAAPRDRRLAPRRAPAGADGRRRGGAAAARGRAGGCGRSQRSAGGVAALSRRARRGAAPRHADDLCLRLYARGVGGTNEDAAWYRKELGAAQPRAAQKVPRRMRYDDPKLRTILAGEYVMGALPPRARARFERLM